MIEKREALEMVHTRQKKYDTITHYLKTNGGSQVTLTFTQFDELLFPHSGLPKTAICWVRLEVEKPGWRSNCKKINIAV